MRWRRIPYIAAFLGCTCATAEDEYRTAANAIAAKPQPVAATEALPTGHLGVQLRAGPSGRPMVVDVETESTAEKMGLKAEDIIARIDGNELTNLEQLRATLRNREAGERIQLSVTRLGKNVDLTGVLAPPSRPLAGVSMPPSLMGVQVAAVRDGEGAIIERIAPGSAAEKAKLKVGETIVRIDDVAVSGPAKLRQILAAKKASDTVRLTLIVAEKQVEMKLKLAETVVPASEDRGPVGGGRGGWNRTPRFWTKPEYRIAIICIEYPDTKHNPKIAPSDWAESMFSEGGKYTKSATGQTTYGSMHDYYFEQSNGQLKIKGKAFDYVEVTKKRMDYNTGDRFVLLREAMDKLVAREGKDALKDFDGVFFIYAGGRTNVARGSLYWPHKANVSHDGKNWQYFICPEGGDRMANISVFCHEFGHMLGLPDLYARPEAPGMEGVGIWSAMANQAGEGKPQHFDAWSKEKLGWVKPVVLDPTVKQKLILRPIADTKECYKVLVQPDASEHFLLENRIAKGYDKSLPAHGLLIWRVIGGRPVLEEAHGIAGPAGPRLFPGAVPFPRMTQAGKGSSEPVRKENDAFTPYTMPSSRAQLGGGLPVFITNIDRRPDGSITFHIGYQYQ